MFSFAILLGATPLAAANHPAQEEAIRTVLTRQTAAWNRGDLDAFVSTYAPDAQFVGAQILRGRDQLLARYRKRYPNAAAMGTLEFSGLEVQLVDSRVATAVGAWHLARVAAGGGDAGGIFSLVLRKRGHTWLIVLDHTH